MEKIIEKYKKAKENELKILEKEISLLNEQINFYETRNKEIREFIENVDFTKCETAIKLQLLDVYIKKLREEQKNNNNKIKSINKKIEKIKEKMKYILGEKKAVEKYIEKIKQEREKEETKKQVQLSDEIFSRRFIK